MPKKRVIIPTTSGNYLTEVGYSVHLAERARHIKLARAVGLYSYKAIILRLNAISIRLRNITPETYLKLRNDMTYLKQRFR
jgi:hypothetical protein